jgi:hypothetical protein
MIFISYAREDERTARQVYADLVRAGFRPWLDREHLDPGSQWEVEIAKAIKSSDVFLALVSSKSLNKKGYVQKEMRLALAVQEELPSEQSYLIPARLDDCRPEDQRLREVTWVDLFPTLNPGMRSITAAVRKHAAPAPTPADERLAVFQVKHEAFWRDGGKRVLNSMLAQARIRKLMAARMSEEKDELKMRVAWLFREGFSTLKPPSVSFASFSSDGALVVAEYANGVNLFWDAETGVFRNIGGLFLTNRFQDAARTRLLQPLECDGLIHSTVKPYAKPVRLVGHTAHIRVCAFSDDNTRIITGAQDRTARLWDATTGDPLMVMGGHPDWVTAVALSPNGEHAVTASGTIDAKEYGDQRVRLWDLRTKRLKALLRGHPPGPGLWDLAFNRRSGDRLVSASLDGSVCLWDCDYWTKVADMRFHNTMVQSAQFSPDGKKVVTASLDGYVVVWPVFLRIETLDEAMSQLRKP